VQLDVLQAVEVSFRNVFHSSEYFRLEEIAAQGEAVGNNIEKGLQLGAEAVDGDLVFAVKTIEHVGEHSDCLHVNIVLVLLIVQVLELDLIAAEDLLRVVVREVDRNHPLDLHAAQNVVQKGEPLDLLHLVNLELADEQRVHVDLDVLPGQVDQVQNSRLQLAEQDKPLDLVDFDQFYLELRAVP